jgi:hypothetical protein
MELCDWLMAISGLFLIGYHCVSCLQVRRAVHRQMHVVLGQVSEWFSFNLSCKENVKAKPAWHNHAGLNTN